MTPGRNRSEGGEHFSRTPRQPGSAGPVEQREVLKKELARLNDVVVQERASKDVLRDWWTKAQMERDEAKAAQRLITDLYGRWPKDKDAHSLHSSQLEDANKRAYSHAAKVG